MYKGAIIVQILLFMIQFLSKGDFLSWYRGKTFPKSPTTNQLKHGDRLLGCPVMPRLGPEPRENWHPNPPRRTQWPNEPAGDEGFPDECTTWHRGKTEARVNKKWMNSKRLDTERGAPTDKTTCLESTMSSVGPPPPCPRPLQALMDWLTC